MKKKLHSIKVHLIQLPILFVFLIAAIISDNANPARADILENDTSKINQFIPSSKTRQKSDKSGIAMVNSEKISNEVRNEETSKSENQNLTTTTPSQVEEQIVENATPNPTPTEKLQNKIEINCNKVPLAADEIIACTTPTPSLSKEINLPTPGNSCVSSGGFWDTLPNSCGDSCALITNPDLQCLMVLTEGCNCGPDKCWNGSSCTDNPQIIPAITKTPVLPVCGNGICEVGEKSSAKCMVCDPDGQICSDMPCKDGLLCTQDCK